MSMARSCVQAPADGKHLGPGMRDRATVAVALPRGVIKAVPTKDRLADTSSGSAIRDSWSVHPSAGVCHAISGPYHHTERQHGRRRRRRGEAEKGVCHRSRDFRDALESAQHRFTRTDRPQTNVKIKRFSRTLMTEWACAATYASDAVRTASYTARLHIYDRHRPHTDGQTPAQNALTKSRGSTTRYRAAAAPRPSGG